MKIPTPPVLPRPATPENRSPRAVAAAWLRQNANDASHNGGMRIRCRQRASGKMKKKVFQTWLNSRARRVFIAFRRKDFANARQTYGSYRCDNSVFPPPAPAQLPVPPALATLTSSCLKTAPTAAYQHLDRRGFITVYPRRKINARSTGIGRESSSEP